MFLVQSDTSVVSILFEFLNEEIDLKRVYI